MEKITKNEFAESVRNLYRDVVVADKTLGTEEKKFKAVFGKYGQLNRDVSKAYKKRLTELIIALKAYTDTDMDGRSRNAAITALQAVADFYVTSIDRTVNKITIQKRDFEYFLRYAFTQRLDKDLRVEANTLGMNKVNKQFQRLMYYKVNRIKTPSVGFNKSTEKAVIRLAEEKKAENQRIKNDKSTKVLKSDAKKAEKRIDQKAKNAEKAA